MDKQSCLLQIWNIAPFVNIKHRPNQCRICLRGYTLVYQCALWYVCSGVFVNVWHVLRNSSCFSHRVDYSEVCHGAHKKG